MRRMPFLMLTWSVLALGFGHAAPARPLYEPEEPPKLPAPVIGGLNGTAWLGKYNTVDRVFILEPDGTVSYRSTLKTSKVFKERGFWKFEGNILTFEHYVNPKSKLMEFRGTVKDAKTIVGEATYLLLNGKKAPQTLRRTTLEIKGLP
jgi:hypothetical protein